MENQPAKHRNEKFEHLLWKNELEFNRRELAIFESYLLNIQRKIHPDRLSQMMTEIYQYCHLVEKMLAEIAGSGQCISNPAISNDAGPKKEACKYMREELFYYEQNYRRFKNNFCSLAEDFEAA